MESFVLGIVLRHGDTKVSKILSYIVKDAT